MHARPWMYDISVPVQRAVGRAQKSCRVVGDGKDCVGEVHRAHSIMNRVHHSAQIKTAIINHSTT